MGLLKSPFYHFILGEEVSPPLTEHLKKICWCDEPVRSGVGKPSRSILASALKYCGQQVCSILYTY